MLVYKEFRDGFTPYESLTTSDGILLRIFKLQHVDSINDNDIYTCPVTLGHKNKHNITTEYAYVDEMNKIEDPDHAL